MSNLEYHLVDNNLTERPDDMMAVTVPNGTLDKEGVIDAILKRGTTLTRTDVVAVANAMEEVITDAAENGITINMPLFNTSFSISGVFEGAMDSFDPNRHKLNVNITKGVKMRNAEKKVKLTKSYTKAGPVPEVMEVKDTMSGTVNSELTPGGMIEIYGRNIKIDGENQDCGLYFVAADGTATKAAHFAVNKPTTIVAAIPATLASGAQQVKIFTQFSGGSNLLKTPKVIVYPKTLTVK
jgi:hypothetical protein